jgi:hypothetical protein
MNLFKSIKLLRTIFILFSFSYLLNGCQKETETFRSEKISDYYPLQIGRIITYKLDSTVYVNLSTVKEVHSYIVKDKIDATITDNLGRLSYKVRRSIRSNTDTTKWSDMGSYLVTNDSTQLEVVQDNLRFIKLREPITKGFNWRGNSYINTLTTPELQYLNYWEYEYEQVRRPFTINGISYTETITVNQQNDSLGSPGDKKYYYEIIFSKEVYSKSIGLIYKEFLHEGWQPGNINSPAGYYEANSYGLKLTMISNNF